jgi:hypothetical protein
MRLPTRCPSVNRSESSSNLFCLIPQSVPTCTCARQAELLERVDCESLGEEPAAGVAEPASVCLRARRLHHLRVPWMTSPGMSCSTLAQVDQGNAQSQCVTSPWLGARTCNFPMAGVTLAQTT